MPMSPQVPVYFVTPSMVYRAPRASQLSSISHNSFLSQKSLTAPRSKGLPSVWAIITAFVFSDSAASSIATSMLYWGIVTSTNTGTAPYCKIGAIVVGNPQATVITSSPLLIRRFPRLGEVSAMNAIRFAEEPLFTRCAHFTPSHCANSCSNRSANLPVVSQKSRDASIRADISFSSNTLRAYGILSPG